MTSHSKLVLLIVFESIYVSFVSKGLKVKQSFVGPGTA